MALSSETAANDPRQLFLRDWIAAHEGELMTVLRPIGGALAGVRGMGPTEATSELLVEVTSIALRQAYDRYDLAFPSWRNDVTSAAMVALSLRPWKWRTSHPILLIIL
jgi:hypothetical protein